MRKRNERGSEGPRRERASAWPRSTATAIGVLTLALVATGGCGPTFGPRARYGITFYCPGAGSVDAGEAGLRAGLERAGYKGQVSRLQWSYTFNPAIDQSVRAIARLGGASLAGYVRSYLKKYPQGEVSIVGLSAGSGVAIYALEDLKAPYQVNNVVLLGSSLSHDYDVSKALKRVKGKIYNFWSPHDAILAGPMLVFGTIDGKFLTAGAGAVGLQTPPGAGDRVVNIRWRPEFERYGYAGGHVDATSPAFVRQYIAPYLIPKAAPPPARETAAATPPAKVLPAAHRD